MKGGRDEERLGDILEGENGSRVKESQKRTQRERIKGGRPFRGKRKQGQKKKPEGERLSSEEGRKQRQEDE